MRDREDSVDGVAAETAAPARRTRKEWRAQIAARANTVSELYAQGQVDAQIAVRLGISRTRVGQIRKRFGIHRAEREVPDRRRLAWRAVPKRADLGGAGVVREWRAEGWRDPERADLRLAGLIDGLVESEVQRALAEAFQYPALVESVARLERDATRAAFHPMLAAPKKRGGQCKHPLTSQGNIWYCTLAHGHDGLHRYDIRIAQ